VKAIVRDKYGPPEVLYLKEVAKPLPSDKEVLIKIHVAAINMGDCELRSSKIPNSIWLLVRLFFGLFWPRKKILGAYFSGEIIETGKSVKRFKPGDRILSCSAQKFSAYAEFITLKENEAIARLPENCSYREAAPLGIGLDALHFLSQANIQPGQKVLVNGAGGGIGTVAVQLARLYGAEVTAVDRSEKLDMLCSIGAARVIDFQKEDFAKDKSHYDAIFDLVGKKSFSRSMQSLRPGGIYLQANPDGLSQMFRGWFTGLLSNKRVYNKFADASSEGLAELARLVSEGKIKSVVDRSYNMEQIVEAHHYVESGKKLGSVVLNIAE
jgi:NADPH:quinone reductase-like Zn-dependent oxidoreductase